MGSKSEIGRWAPTGQRPVELDWTVTEQGSGYQIVELSIDGVNQALTERSQFGDLIARNGGSLPSLIAQMQTDTGIRPPFRSCPTTPGRNE
jgi:ABC-type transporter MlaC component